MVRHYCGRHAMLGTIFSAGTAGNNARRHKVFHRIHAELTVGHMLCREVWHALSDVSMSIGIGTLLPTRFAKIVVRSCSHRSVPRTVEVGSFHRNHGVVNIWEK